MVNTYLKCIPAAILIICFLVVFVKETIHRQLSSQINKNSAETETLTRNLDVSKRKLQFENMFDSVGIAGGVGGSKKRRGSRGGSGGRQRRVAPVPVLQNSAASKLKISAEGKTRIACIYHHYHLYSVFVHSAIHCHILSDIYMYVRTYVTQPSWSIRPATICGGPGLPTTMRPTRLADPQHGGLGTT